MHRTVTFISLLLLLSTSSVHAKTYKWIDKNGDVHYSATQPPASATSSKTLKTQSAAQDSKSIPEYLTKKNWLRLHGNDELSIGFSLGGFSANINLQEHKSRTVARGSWALTGRKISINLIKIDPDYASEIPTTLYINNINDYTLNLSDDNGKSWKYISAKSKPKGELRKEEQRLVGNWLNKRKTNKYELMKDGTFKRRNIKDLGGMYIIAGGTWDIKDDYLVLSYRFHRYIENDIEGSNTRLTGKEKRLKITSISDILLETYDKKNNFTQQFYRVD